MTTITTPDWVRDAIFYQIFPDRFARSDRVAKPANLQPWGAPPTYHGFQGGDLLGIAEKLDYLVDLGVNALYLNPIFASASNHRYHTNDYFSVDPLLGGHAAFCELRDAAHARGVRLVLDGVFNHCGRGFFQFNHLLECRAESPYANWFHVRSWPVNAYSEHEPPNFDAWWNLHALPKFNTDNDMVREFLWRVGTYWLEQGIDGWRLDVPNEIDDDGFWREFRRRCKAVNPEAYIVGELWGEAQHWLQGDQFDAQMNYPFTRAAYGFILGEKMDTSELSRTGYGLIPVLDAAQFGATLNHINNHLYAREIVRVQLNMLGSHDTPRLRTVARDDLDAVALLFLAQMTQPGAPNIYYGDEIGLPGRHDPDCRRAFPWQDGDSWAHQLRATVRDLIHLRRASPALRRGDFHLLRAADHVVVYARRTAVQTAVVAINVAADARRFTITDLAAGAPLAPQLGAAAPLKPGSSVTLPGRSGEVWLTEYQ